MDAEIIASVVQANDILNDLINEDAQAQPAASARSALNAERNETTSSRRCATSAARRNATASTPSSRRRGGKLRARFPFRSTTAKNSIAT